SPCSTSKSTSLTAATHPVFSRRSSRDRDASELPGMRSARGPKTFHSPSARTARSVIHCLLVLVLQTRTGAPRPHARVSPNTVERGRCALAKNVVDRCPYGVDSNSPEQLMTLTAD